MKKDITDYDTIFNHHLPDTLYLNQYELTQEYGGTPAGWRQYLNENKQFIASELATISEAQARKALSSLDKDLTAQQVAGFKEIIKNSSLINNQQQQPHTYILTNMNDQPDTEYPFYVRLGLGSYTHPDTLYFDYRTYLVDKKHDKVKYQEMSQKEWSDLIFKLKENKTSHEVERDKNHELGNTVSFTGWSDDI